MPNAEGKPWNNGFMKELSTKTENHMTGCKCTMAQIMVGDGCDICNPELAKEHEELNRFDNWFDKNGYSEEHRDIFEIVWTAAIASR